MLHSVGMSEIASVSPKTCRSHSASGNNSPDLLFLSTNHGSASTTHDVTAQPDSDYHKGASTFLAQI
jgi:hypothetical protein